LLPQIDAMARPAVVDPVNEILSTSSWRTSASPVAGPPVTIRRRNVPLCPAELLAGLGQLVPSGLGQQDTRPGLDLLG
jgi:hypothetical protein